VKVETRALREKAERSIRATETLLDAGDAEFAVGRAYYSAPLSATETQV